MKFPLPLLRFAAGFEAALALLLLRSGEISISKLAMAIKEMSELTKAICNLQRAVTFNYRNGAKIKVAHESVREEIADVYIMLAQLVEIVGKPEEVQQIVLEKLEQLKGDLDGGEVQSE